MTRDELLARALDMTDSLQLDQRERPGGSIQTGAMSIQWLQDGIDTFHRVFPWTSLIATSSVSITTSTTSYTLPTDFSRDVQNGVRIMSAGSTKRRLLRKDYNWLLNQDTTTDRRGIPSAYVVMPPNLIIFPYADQAYTATLSYYKLPGQLAAGDRPTFPDDWTLVEYVRLRGQEWLKESEPGTAMAYARKVIGDLTKSGIGIEADITDIPLDPGTFRRSPWPDTNPFDWMGVERVVQ